MPKSPILLRKEWKNHLLSLLQTCPTMTHLQQILTQFIINGLYSDNFIISRIISFCATSNRGDLNYAQFIFNHSQNPTAFAYNSLIRGYVTSTTPLQSLYLFHKMLESGIYPDKYTFPFVLKASTSASSLVSASKIHSLIVKFGLEEDLHIQTSLLHFYGSSNCINESQRVFDEMPERSIVTWNAIISCYSKLGHEVESMILFGDMVRERVEINEDTVISVLTSCANLGKLIWGRCIHGFVVRMNFNLRGAVPNPLGTTLVHMYVKCGDLVSGTRVFEKMDKRDASAWTAMIGGMAMHGRGKEALSLFEEMVQGGIRPDSVTFTSVLHGCSHSGLVEEGLKVFNSMGHVYGIEGRIEHYGSVVDLIGRAGRLKQAEQFIESMPIRPNGVVWASLMSSCLAGGDVETGERIGKKVLGLGSGVEELDASFYVVMSNLYAKVGRWEEVRKVRETVVERGMRKERGFSLVEVNGRVHKFLVGDSTHPFTMEIHGMLNVITKEIKLSDSYY